MRPQGVVPSHVTTGIGVVVVLALVILLAPGCDEAEPLNPVASLLATVPGDGLAVAEGTTVTLTFDSDPGIVIVNGIAAQGSGTVRTFPVAVDGGMAISWGASSTAALEYLVIHPDVTSPELVSVDPRVVGKTDVDPAEFADGLGLQFSEPVSFENLTISTGGSALIWVATTDGTTLTLNANPDDPVVTETRYEVVGSVVDRAGNVTEVAFWFRTSTEPL